MVAVEVIDARDQGLREEEFQRIAALLKEGGLVAIPTETVYGLAALSTHEEGVRRIFEAKGRPSTNPLILHVDSVEQARALTSHWPPVAEKLARAFWPGPLTLVLPKAPSVSPALTAGLESVALRMPAHKVAQAIIAAAGPLAAPSANRYTELSPTRASHVLKGLGERVDLIVDGGPCTVGLESTILSLLDETPRILRPGMISKVEIENLLGHEILERKGEIFQQGQAHPSPGLSRKHYSPQAPLILLEEKEFFAALQAAAQKNEEGQEDRYRYLGLSSPEVEDSVLPEPGERLFLPPEPEQYAALLYQSLHHLDGADIDGIYLQAPPSGTAWNAIWDRLRRALSLT